MKSAQAAYILKATCIDNVMKLEFSKPSGPKFHFNLSSNKTIGDMPLVQDPYEAMTVKLDKSTIPNSGHGLFTIRDINKHELLALYNGFRQSISPNILSLLIFVINAQIFSSLSSARY